jgi:hypothetical protein
MGLIHPKLVETNHKTKITDTVAMLMAALGPSPGILNALVFSGAAGFVVVLASDMDGLPVVNDGKDFFAHADEFGF